MYAASALDGGVVVAGYAAGSSWNGVAVQGISDYSGTSHGDDASVCPARAAVK